jgi:hypothetical protein
VISRVQFAVFGTKKRPRGRISVPRNQTTARGDRSGRSGTVRDLPPFVAPRRRRRCGRSTLAITSPIQLRDLRHAQAAAARQPEDDEVSPRVRRFRRLRLGIGEDGGEFAAREDEGRIDVPGRGVHADSGKMVAPPTPTAASAGSPRVLRTSPGSSEKGAQMVESGVIQPMLVSS